MTDAEARIEFQKMTPTELRVLAEQNNIPVSGLSDGELIDALLGNCPKCKGGKMTVVYEGRSAQNNFNQPAPPCVECDKNK